MDSVNEYTQECQRFNLAIDWLIFNNIASSRKQLAKTIGFSESMLSLVANNKQRISERFLISLSHIAPMINIQWISTGEGDMIKEIPAPDNDAELMEAIRRQQELIVEANKTLGNLIGNCSEDLLKMQLDLISSYQEGLSALTSQLSVNSGSVIYKSNINSHNNSNNRYYGGHKGRKPNFSKFHNKGK